MKVIDLESYRAKKQREQLGKKVAELALFPTQNCAGQIKTCFKEWVKTAKSK